MTTVAEVQKYLNILGYKKGGGGGVTFPITLAQGGLGQANTPALGAVPYSTATSIALSAASTKLGQYFRSGAAGIPSWSTLTLPDTIGINNIFVASAANVVGTIGSTNSSIFYTSATGVPAWSNAATVDANGNFVTTAGIVETNSLYLVPVTGFSITLAVANHLTSLNPAGTLAAGTITMPAAPVNGQRLKVATTQTITALTVNANTGQTILAAPTTLLAGDSFEYIYNLALTAWYPYEGTGQQLPSATLLGNALGTPGGAVPIQLGTGLSFTGNVLNAIGGGGSGTVSAGTAGTIAFYAANGTTVTPLSLGTNLSITGTTLNAAGGGGGSVTITGDTGSVTGSSLSLTSHITTNTSGSSVSFTGSGTTLTFQLTDALFNTLIGVNAGNATLTGGSNTGVGQQSLYSLTSGQENSGFGINSLLNVTTSQFNTAVGSNAGFQLITGSSNTLIGRRAGFNYTGNESNNVLLNHAGVLGESNVLRLSATGTGAQQVSKSFIGGIYGVTPVSTPQLVMVGSTDQLGAIASANVGVLVTNATGIPSVLPSPGAIGQVLVSDVATKPFWGVNLWNGTAATVGGVLYGSTTSLVLNSAASVVTRAMLWGNVAGAPTFAPYQMPATLTANSLLWASSTTLVNQVLTANNGTLVTSSSGIPSIVGASVTRQIIRVPLTTQPTGTSLCTLSPTLPITNTQGDQYISQSITPTVVGSVIEIESQLYVSSTVSGDHIMGGIFNGGTNALVCASEFITTGGAATELYLKTSVVTASLTPITFSVRMGGSSAGTRTVNPYFGATGDTYMILTEKTA